MPEVTRYRRPWPQTADEGGPTSTCPARRQGWNCTRVAGHNGDHQAGGTRGQMYASWPANDETETEETP